MERLKVIEMCSGVSEEGYPNNIASANIVHAITKKGDLEHTEYQAEQEHPYENMAFDCYITDDFIAVNLTFPSDDDPDLIDFWELYNKYLRLRNRANFSDSQEEDIPLLVINILPVEESTQYISLMNPIIAFLQPSEIGSTELNAIKMLFTLDNFVINEFIED